MTAEKKVDTPEVTHKSLMMLRWNTLGNLGRAVKQRVDGCFATVVSYSFVELRPVVRWCAQQRPATMFSSEGFKNGDRS